MTAKPEISFLRPVRVRSADGKQFLDDCTGELVAEIEGPRGNAEFFAAAINAALACSPPPAVGVKPLEWEATKEMRRHLVKGSVITEYRSKGIFQYTLTMNIRTGGSWDATRGTTTPIQKGTCVSLNEAKAAAQADYATRIRSALVASPAPPAGGEVEPVALPDEKPSAPDSNRPEWIWYCESTSGFPVISLGRWPKNPQQARYKLADIQPTEHDHPASLAADKAALEEENERLKELHMSICRLNLELSEALSASDTRADAAEARLQVVEAALTWYGEQADLCRKLTSEGEKGRNALDNDGGKRARAALDQKGGEK